MERKKIRYNPLVYSVLKLCCAYLSRVRFGSRIVRNEIRGKKGPMVIIANHQAAFDFVNMYRITNRRISIVASNSFYQTLPVKGLMDMVGIIPKQQFQTTPADMRAMRHVVDDGGILGIYPAGLMCEDGLSTPIPNATWKFLQWMRADVYVLRSTGTYFCTPKWSKKKRRGKTLVDAYRLFTKEELEQLTPEQVRERAAAALGFDAYRENDGLKVEYKGGDNVEGLENVLYVCPHCGSEFTMRVRDGSVIYCSECGYAERSDRCGMLSVDCEIGEEIRYVSDWARMIYNRELARVESGEDITLTEECDFMTVDPKKKKFVKTGEGSITLSRESITLSGNRCGEPFELSVAASAFPSLPFSPGEYIEIQDGADIYRCALRDGKRVMKYINLLKAIHSLEAVAEC